MMRRTSESSIFWPVDDAERQSSPLSASVQPVIDAGKLKRSSVEGRPSPLGSLLSRRLNTAVSPTATMALGPPPKLLPEKTGHDYRGRCASAVVRPQWTSTEASANTSSGAVLASDSRTPWRHSDDATPRRHSVQLERISAAAPGLTKSPSATSRWTSAGASVKVRVGSSGSVVDDDDGRTPWRHSDDATRRRHSVQLCGTMERTSAAGTGLDKCPSATSLSAPDRRRRPWLSRYLQQFADETDDDGEAKPRRRRGSVAALIDSFEQCAMQYRAAVQPTGVPRRAIHGSLTSLDSIDRTRGWGSSGVEKTADSSGSATPPSDFTSKPSSCSSVAPVPVQSHGEYVKTRMTRNRDTDAAVRRAPTIASQTAISPPPCGEYVKTWMARNNCARLNVQDTDAARRRSSVDVIRRALGGSLTSLNCVDAARRRSNSSDQVTAHDDINGSDAVPPSDITSTKSPPPLSSQPRPKLYGDYIEQWKKRNDRQLAERRASVDVTTPVPLYPSQNGTSLNRKPEPRVQPLRERRLSVLVGRERTNGTDDTDSNESAHPTAGFRGKSSGNVADNQQIENEPVYGTSAWAGAGPTSHVLSTADARSDSTVSCWVDKSVASFDDSGGDFESDFWQQHAGSGGTLSPRRPGSLVSEGNATSEDSGVASVCEHASSIADWSRSDVQEPSAAQDGGNWSRYSSRPETDGEWMTHRAADDDDDDDDKPSTSAHTDSPSQHHLDTESTEFRTMLSGN